jgi:hypothetical protein
MTIDYNALSDKELVQHFFNMDLPMIVHISANLSPERAANIVRLLEEETAEDVGERICAFFMGLQTKEQVTEVGRVMNTRYTLKLIEEAVKLDHSHLWKISALLIGLTHRVFLKVLDTASPKELEVIQHEALKEPIQHHLTVFVHEVSSEVDEKVKQVMNLNEKAEKTPADNISFEDIHDWLVQINSIAESFEPLITKINRALGIAWNTNRPDLISRLTGVVETIQRTQKLLIGTPRTRSALPTGFFAALEGNVCAVYGKAGDAEALLDDEPAVEALAMLSLWYLKDYWQVGLLPHIKDESELRLDPESHSDKECRNFRESLMAEVNKNLENLDLATVGDFKAAYIGSRDILKETIRQRQKVSLITRKS